jgi:hypothetical protein
MNARDTLALDRIIRDAMTAHIQRGAPIDTAVRAVRTAAVAYITKGAADPASGMPQERPLERTSRENRLALQIMTDFAARGRGRCGAASAAKRLAGARGLFQKIPGRHRGRCVHRRPRHLKHRRTRRAFSRACSSTLELTSSPRFRSPRGLAAKRLFRQMGPAT